MNESTTIDRCKAGDQAAFTELFSTYRDGAYRYCLGMVGSNTDALDIVQEAFLAAFQGIGRLDSERGFGGWFYGIVRHLCMATLRQRKREPAASSASILATKSQSSTPEENAHQLERKQLLVSCLELLTEVQKEVLILREFESMTYQDIAQRLEIPTGTVMSRLYDARRALARLIKEKTGGEQ